jgi:MinD-like ATPase involved in chromosome partitioning or flagellar assembly
VIVDVARRLELPRVQAIINELPAGMEAVAVTSEVERIYQCPVIGVIPHDDILTTLPRPALVAIHYPEHYLSTTFSQIAKTLRH